MAFPLDAATFKQRFPEFKDLGEALVQAALDEAELDIDEDIWGDNAERGQGLRAADLLIARAPGKEVSKDGTTSYGRQYERLVAKIGAAYRCVLD